MVSVVSSASRNVHALSWSRWYGYARLPLVLLRGGVLFVFAGVSGLVGMLGFTKREYLLRAQLLTVPSRNLPTTMDTNGVVPVEVEKQSSAAEVQNRVGSVLELPSIGAKETQDGQLQTTTWDLCQTCNRMFLPPQWQWETRVCIGDRSNITWSKRMSKSGTEGIPCDACLRCPRCESCYTNATAFATIGTAGARKKMLLKIKDSVNQDYLAKVASPSSSYLLTSIQQIVEHCGFQDIVPWETYGPLHATWMAGSREVEVDATSVVFSELRKGHWVPLPPGVVRLNETQVVRAALFDFLIAAGDRGPRNILYERNTRAILLIDNYHHCCKDSPSSLFVPGSAKYFKFWVTHSKHLDLHLLTPNLSHPMMSFELTKCLDELANGTKDQIRRKYFLRGPMLAEVQERARLMISGFGAAIVHQHCMHARWNTSKYFALKNLQISKKDRLHAWATIDRRWQTMSSKCTSQK